MNKHVGGIIGFLMMYTMLRFDDSELRYHCFSRTTPYHPTIPVV